MENKGITMENIVTDKLIENIKSELQFEIKLIEPEIRKDKNGQYIVIGTLDERYSLTDPRSTVDCRPKLKCLPDGYKLFIQANESIVLRKY